jgi:chemosensory pili system protein ChpA (sensor histidine kinase/response regulator)
MPSVLYIEDTSEQRDLVAFFLELNGYQVSLANDGVEGLAQARKLRPDLILLDLGMPKMDGFQVMEEMRNDENLKDIPVVVLSAWAAAKHQEQAEAAGAQAFITKPFELADVLATVHRFVLPG